MSNSNENLLFNHSSLPTRKVMVIGAIPPPWGGVEVVTKYVLNSDLARHFHLVLFDIAKSRGKEYSGRLDFHNTIAALWHFLGLIRAIRRERPALVYMPMVTNRFGFVRDCGFLILSRLFCDGPVIVHVHSNDFDQFYSRRNPIKQRLISRTLALATRVILLSERWYRFFATFLPKEKLTIVQNSIDQELARELERIPVPAEDSSDAVHVLFLGALGRRKGVDDLLRAAALIKEQERVVTIFDLCGPEDVKGELDMLHDLSRSRNLEEMVRFHGPVAGRRKTQMLRQADMLVLPSHKEGMPLVLIEAFAAELPVISTPVGSIPEMLRDGENGFLVTPGDAEGLAQRIEDLAGDPELRRRMGVQNLKAYRALYTLDRAMVAMRAVFDEALHERASVSRRPVLR